MGPLEAGKCRNLERRGEAWGLSETIGRGGGGLVASHSPCDNSYLLGPDYTKLFPRTIVSSAQKPHEVGTAAIPI